MSAVFVLLGVAVVLSAAAAVAAYFDQPSRDRRSGDAVGRQPIRPWNMVGSAPDTLGPVPIDTGEERENEPD